MQKWDICLWYHSNEWKEIVWIATVSKTAYQDPTAKGVKWDWVVVDVVPYKSLNTPVTLEIVGKDKILSTMCLIKRQRLSVAPVTKKEFDRILLLGGA
jgi:predicted RNA-binding protein with PUA-like domain